MRHLRLPTVLLATLAAACGKPKSNADSAAAAAAATTIDTVKPDSTGIVTAIDSTPFKAPPASKTAAVTKSGATKSTKRASTRDTTHLGRDSAIQTDPRDPRRQLPTVPPKKPPQ